MNPDSPSEPLAPVTPLPGVAAAAVSEPAFGSSEPARAVIVVAAGSGQRLGAERPKAFVGLAGRSILEHCLDGVFGMDEPAQVIVVAPAALVADAEEIAVRAAGAASADVSVVSGGATRQESVRAGLGLLLDSVHTVLVHDAARALTPAAQLDRVAALVERTGGGVVPGLPVADTIKSVDGDETITGTVDRSSLRAVQTPQGFPREQILAAYARGGDDHTDDAALCAAHGFASTVVPGDPLAAKITTPWDLQRAERLLAERALLAAAGLPAVFGAGAASGTSATSGESVHSGVPASSSAAAHSSVPASSSIAAHSSAAAHAAASATSPSPAAPLAAVSPLRTGLGVDVHAFDDNEPLWLAGLHWPNEPGLSGHSDGDAVAHAIVDAVLGAAGLGDIGGMFGTDDPRFDGAHGSVFLAAALDRIRDAGYRIVNVNVQIIGNRPRFSPRRTEAEELLTGLLGAPVSLSATTTDGLGFTGRGEGVMAIANALLSSAPSVPLAGIPNPARLDPSSPGDRPVV